MGVKTLLVAVAKDEGPYIREWAIYHKKICGFTDIIVYENDSSDGTREQLEKLHSEGVCSWKPWPRSENNPPQQKAYWDSIKNKDQYDWMCILDVDEFLVLKGDEGIGDFVSRFDEKAGSISFNWIIFYSTDEKFSNEPVIKRVNNCYGDTHVKTIARTKAIATAAIHTFPLKAGYDYMHCSGAKYEIKPGENLDLSICRGSSKLFEAQSARINHYLIKSHEEAVRKDERGRAYTKIFVKKETEKQYNSMLRWEIHSQNHSIKKFIELRYGLEKFYKEVAV